jgi:hypothetical protein
VHTLCAFLQRRWTAGSASSSGSPRQLLSKEVEVLEPPRGEGLVEGQQHGPGVLGHPPIARRPRGEEEDEMAGGCHDLGGPTKAPRRRGS